MYEPSTPIPADAASQQPPEARAGSCACQGGPRRPDPTDRYMEMLDELAGLGMKLARLLVAEAEEPAADPAEPAPPAAEHIRRAPAGLAFDRVSRAVRLCMALSLKFRTERLEREQGTAKPRAADGPRQPSPKGEIERRVKDAIEQASEREGEADPLVEEVLHRALSERLEEDSFERDLKRYSVDELVERICRDLGVEPPAEPGADTEDDDGPPPFEEAWPGAGMPLDGEAWAIDYQFFVDLGMATPNVPHYTGPDPYLILQPLPPLPDAPGGAKRPGKKSPKRPGKRPSG